MTLRAVAEVVTASGKTPLRSAPNTPVVYATIGGVGKATLYLVDDLGQVVPLGSVGDLTSSSVPSLAVPPVAFPPGSSLYWDVTVSGSDPVTVAWFYFSG